MSEPARDRSGTVPGMLLFHPLVLVAVLALGLNDHIFKALSPGLVTGKLSDVAGMVFFPVFLFSAIEWGSWASGRAAPGHATLMVWCAGLTGVVFAAVNLSVQCGQAYLSAVGTLWEVFGFPSAHFRHVTDPWDLLALPFLIVPLGLTFKGRSAAPHFPAAQNS